MILDLTGVLDIGNTKYAIPTFIGSRVIALGESVGDPELIGLGFMTMCTLWDSDEFWTKIAQVKQEVMVIVE